MVNPTLIDKLLSRDTNISSFHTPGHKNKCSYIKDISKFDYTEILDLDSLFEAKECILESEKRLAQLYNSEKAYISAGGCTACIQTMLRQVAPVGGKLVCSRIIHESAINTMALLNIEPVWVLPRADAGDNLPGRIYAEDIERVLSSTEDVKGVYITSPDYYGVISCIDQISKVCRKYGVPLLVDAAHGSHLKFIDTNLSPIDLGADLVAFSWHKTLPALTGAAVLCVDNYRYTQNVKDSMAMFASTSPSYAIMASIDLCREWLIGKSIDEFRETIKYVNRIKRLANSKGISQPYGICDPMRITLNTASIGLRGETAVHLFRKHKIEPEFYDDSYVVLIATPFNTHEDFSKLEKTIRDLPTSKPIINKPYHFDIPTAKLNPNEAIFTESQVVNADDSLGRVSAQTVFSCPPGIPLVIPGEVVTNNTLNLFKYYGIKSLKVVY